MFNVGDAIATNYSLFQWKIESITHPNAGNSGVSYKGALLDNCDISSIFANGVLASWTVDFTALMNCSSPDMSLLARADFSISALPGIHTPFGLFPGTTEADGESSVFANHPRGSALNVLSVYFISSQALYF